MTTDAGLSRQTKTWIIGELQSRLKTVPHVVVAEFASLNPQISGQLRRQLRHVSATCAIAKRTLVLRALDDTPYQEAAQWITGPTAIVLAEDDPVPVSKVLTECLKENEKAFTLKGAIIDGRTLDASAIKTLASLPSREILLTQLVCRLNAPIQGLASGLHALVQQVVQVLDQIRKQKEEGPNE